jgi:hypothetical protein
MERLTNDDDFLHHVRAQKRLLNAHLASLSGRAGADADKVQKLFERLYSQFRTLLLVQLYGIFEIALLKGSLLRT